MDQTAKAKLKRVLLAVVIGGLIVYTLAGPGRTSVGESGPVLTDPIPGVEQSTVFYFFTEHCPSCRQMQPQLDQALADCKDSSLDFKLVNPSQEKNYDLGRIFQIQAVPTTVFVDDRGRERGRHIGAMSAKNIKETIARLIDVSCP